MQHIYETLDKTGAALAIYAVPTQQAYARLSVSHAELPTVIYDRIGGASTSVTSPGPHAGEAQTGYDTLTGTRIGPSMAMYAHLGETGSMPHNDRLGVGSYDSLQRGQQLAAGDGYDDVSRQDDVEFRSGVYMYIDDFMSHPSSLTAVYTVPALPSDMDCEYIELDSEPDAAPPSQHVGLFHI